MRSCILGPTVRPAGRLAPLVFAALIAANGMAEAAAAARAEQASRPAGEPVMAIVSLRDQQITVYDDQGWIMRAPVSSGQKGRETPAGVFSVLQKNAEHYSNLYDDAFMPHMQRLTWSGIALHGGALPGYPASHGCVRLPFDFAEKLFGATRLGIRVIVAPGKAEPVAIDQPAPFAPKTGAVAAAALAATKAADEAGLKAEQARLAGVSAYRDLMQAMMPVRKAETLKLRVDWEVGVAERAIAAAETPEAKQQAEEARAKAAARSADLEAQIAAGKVDLQPKLAAMTAARDAATAAENARVAAAEAARKAARDLAPVSVFISLKSQRLYVRQALQPVLEVPVTVADADRPIGTHIFTAVERSGSDIRWSAVSLGAESAAAALDRVTIPPEARDFIAERLWPRSSVIVSDEALSSETGKETEFVVVLSNEPQGGIKSRRPAPPRVEARFGPLRRF